MGRESDTLRQSGGLRCASGVVVIPAAGMIRACLLVRAYTRLTKRLNMKPKSNSVVTVQQTEAGLITVTVLGAGIVTFDPSKVHASNRIHAEFHGWKQRLSDAAAMSRDTDSGKPATPGDKEAAIRELADFYMTGAAEWSRVGTGGGGKSLTIEAIAAIKGVTYEVAEAEVVKFATAKYEGDTKKALAFLRTGAKVSAAMDEIRKARMPAPKVDADEALAELG